MDNKKSHERIVSLTVCAMFVAIIAIMSQISIPMPNYVPVTLQTFAIALCGYFLGVKKGTVTLLVYIFIGAIGAPVFTSFRGGFSVIVGYTGGFIYGFIALVICCGIINNKKIGILLGIAGLIICHLFGVLHYVAVSSNPFWSAVLFVSLPYLPKDIISVIAAYFLASKLRKVMYR